VRYSNSNVYDILVDQGATLNRALFLKTATKRAIALTGYVGRMHIREYLDSSIIVKTLTTENDEIIIDEVLGRVDIFLPPSDTETLEAKNYVYDLELESPDGEVTKVVSGKLTVRSEITY
jgi:hypothetical protein